MKTPDLDEAKALVEEARGFAMGSDPTSARTTLLLDMAQSLEDAIHWIEDDIVSIKEFAPKHLNERVDQYRKRTHAAEEKLDDIMEVLTEYTAQPESSRFPSLALLHIALIVKKG